MIIKAFLEFLVVSTGIIPTLNRFAKNEQLTVYGITPSSLVLGSNVQHWRLEPGMPYTVIMHPICSALYRVGISAFFFAKSPRMSINEFLAISGTLLANM